MSYDVLLKSVAEALSKRDIAAAEKLIAGNPMNEKHPVLFRAHYLVLNHPGSTLHDPKKAFELLSDMVGSFSEPWPCIEMARTLIMRRASHEDIDAAEDLLNKHRDKDLTAKYWLAEIYSKGLNSNSKGEPAYDLKEALSLYRDVLHNAQGRLKLNSLERYCDVALRLGNLSEAQEQEIFTLLNSSAKSSQECEKLLGRFMVGKITSITNMPNYLPKDSENGIIETKKREQAMQIVAALFSGN